VIGSFLRTSEQKANKNFTGERKANSVANEKRTSVDRLLWIISKEVFFYVFL